MIDLDELQRQIDHCLSQQVHSIDKLDKITNSLNDSFIVINQYFIDINKRLDKLKDMITHLK
jgi:hypothetical protein